MTRCSLNQANRLKTKTTARSRRSKPRVAALLVVRLTSAGLLVAACGSSDMNAVQRGGSQVPLLGFIADFYAPSARLVVEVDGAYHARRVTADARRDRKLTRAGHRIVRLRTYPSGECRA